MTTAATRAERPLRVDAARNRSAVIAVAERLFAERGFDVPMAEIAQAAGVGRTTLLRNFPTRMDLAFAVFAATMTEMRDLAARQAGEVGDFAALLDLKLGFYVCNGGLAEAVQKDGLGADFSAERLEVARMLLKAAEPAIRAGRIRADVDVETFVILQQAIGGAMLTGGTRADRHRRAARLRAILLDGLSAR